MQEIILSAILTGLIFAPLGCLVLWKRYAYYGDGLAHASILAGVLSAILDIPLLISGIIVVLFFAIAIYRLKIGGSNNSSIGVTSSIFVSLAITLITIFPVSINIESLLFGDIITADMEMITTLVVILIVQSLFIILNYRKILLFVLNKDIAHSKGINVKHLEFLFLVILSLSVLFTIKLVGALLVTSMIIIPASIARIFSPTPLLMIINSVLVVTAMNICGITMSLYADLPFAPIIILSGGFILAMAIIIKSFIASTK